MTPCPAEDPAFSVSRAAFEEGAFLKHVRGFKAQGTKVVVKGHGGLVVRVDFAIGSFNPGAKVALGVKHRFVLGMDCRS